MPNWCDNDMTFETKKDFEKFKKVASSEECIFDFEKILPTPEDKLEGDGWFDWRCEMWGTKWSLDPKDIFINEEKLYICFPTAWSPAIAMYKEIIRQDPTIRFSIDYEEENMGFWGKFTSYGDGSWEDITGELGDWDDEEDCYVKNEEEIMVEKGNVLEEEIVA